MSEKRWTIREYSPGDETKIAGLFERVFHKPMGATESLRHWHWEYEENPVGPRTAKLVWDGGRLVGHYAVSPRRLWVEGAQRLAALSLDTMTDPDYGREGIFSASAEACYAAMSERGFEFVYGFPNANSVGGIKRRLRWTMLMPTPVLVKPLDIGPLAARALGVPALGGVLGMPARLLSKAPGVVDAAVESVRARARGGPRLELLDFDAFEPWADRLWERCRDQHRLWVIRDEAFLRWRYDERPESEYRRLKVTVEGEVVGYAVFVVSERSEGRIAFIMDLLVDLEVPGVTSLLLQGIEQRARSEGANLLSAMVGPGSPMRPSLLRHAYMPLPERFFPKELHFGGRVLSSAQQFYDPSAWQLTWGDVDVL